ncbi:McrB family protein [Flavobacterium helocola]|uniref:AAA family ATPase n=1 Tax=Flavobacterium helocola TaxID=3139139 RepID=A0ABU9I5J9_9FLAO
MSKSKEILLKLSEDILQYLLKHKEKNPNFTFSLRKRDSAQAKGVKRLQVGQWFQGSHYIYVPLFKRGDKARKIKTIGFVINTGKDGNFNNYIEISFKSGVNDPKEKDFHKRLADFCELKLGPNNHGVKGYPNQKDIFQNLEEYITTFRDFAISLLEELDLKEKYIITEQEFQKDLSRINAIKKILQLDKNQITSESIYTKELKASSMLNQILYGPPGTGKTYNSINKSLEIINDKEVNSLDFSNREAVKVLFDKKIDDEQISFTTFHQSMSYEDFIEGIKPLKPKSDNTTVLYDVVPGIFKNICQKALTNFIESAQTKNTSQINFSFDSLHQAYLEYLLHNDVMFYTINKKEIKFIELKGSSIIVKFIWYNKEKGIEATEPFTVSKSKLKLLFEAGLNPNEITNLKEAFAPFFKHNLSVFYAVYKGFYDFIIQNKGFELSTSEDTITLSDNYEELLDTFLLLSPEEINKGMDESKSFVLIIDEINRGNVSQIFGELITLLENDKRLGKDEALKVVLPYSKEKFGVPPNLYIIGTMNTADRSVEVLDTALRRRFSFEEMQPQPDLLSPSAMYCRLLWKYEEIDWEEEPFISEEENLFNLLGVPESLIQEKKSIWDTMKEDQTRESLDYFDKFNDDFNGINLEKLLKTINDRIEILLDRDHTIGHSYFIKVNSIEDLERTFKRNIIPLLQEYFYSDYEKIGMVLGNGFVELVNKNEVVFPDFIKNNNFKTNGYSLIPIDEDFNIEEAIRKLWK